MRSCRSILFIEQFYYPEGWGGAQLPRDITADLASHGWQVDVLCGSDQYAPLEGDPGPDPSAVGIRIRRIPRLFAGDIHHCKLFRQIWFYLAAVPILLFSRRPDVFATQTNPPLAVPLTALAALVRRRPFVIIAQDVYPEILFAHGMLRRDRLPGRALAVIFGWSYRRAAAVVSLGKTMTSRLQEKGVIPDRIETISNWATGAEALVRGEENRLRGPWGLGGRFVVLYSGNLGIAHDIATPIEAVRQAALANPNIALVFVGKGSRLEEARNLAARLGLDGFVKFFGYVPAEMLPHSLGVADVALVTLQRGFEGLVVPSKALGYLARGVPTLYIGPESDVQELVKSGGGLCFSNGDIAGFAQALIDLAGSHDRLRSMSEVGEAYYRAALDRSIGLGRYRAMLERIVAE